MRRGFRQNRQSHWPTRFRLGTTALTVHQPRGPGRRRPAAGSLGRGSVCLALWACQRSLWHWRPHRYFDFGINRSISWTFGWLVGYIRTLVTPEIVHDVIYSPLDVIYAAAADDASIKLFCPG